MPVSAVPGAKKKKKNPRAKGGDQAEARNELRIKRRKHASLAIEQAVQSRQTPLANAEDIDAVLDDFCETHALDSDHFACLSQVDRLELLIEIKNAQSCPAAPSVEQASSCPSLPHGLPPTPDNSLNGNIRQAQDEEPTSLDDIQDNPIKPVEDSQSLELLFYVRSPPDYVVGCHYKCRKSYVSDRIVKRLHLQEDRHRPGSARVVWRENAVAKGGSKTKETRFWFCNDELLEHDVAIGQDWKIQEPRAVAEIPDEKDNEDDDQSNCSEDNSRSDASDDIDSALAEISSDNEDEELQARHNDGGCLTINAQGEKLISNVLTHIASKVGKRTRSSATPSILLCGIRQEKPAKTLRIDGRTNSPNRSSRKSTPSRAGSAVDQPISRTKERKT